MSSVDVDKSILSSVDEDESILMLVDIRVSVTTHLVLSLAHGTNCAHSRRWKFSSTHDKP